MDDRRAPAHVPFPTGSVVRLADGGDYPDPWCYLVLSDRLIILHEAGRLEGSALHICCKMGRGWERVA